MTLFLYTEKSTGVLLAYAIASSKKAADALIDREFVREGYRSGGFTRGIRVFEAQVDKPFAVLCEEEIDDDYA